MCALWGLRFRGQVPGRGPLSCILAEPRDAPCFQLLAKLLIGLVGPGPAPQQEKERLVWWPPLQGGPVLSELVSETHRVLLGRKVAPRKCMLPFSLSRPFWQPRPIGRRQRSSGRNPSSLSTSQRLTATQAAGLLRTHFHGSEDAVQLLSLPFLGGVHYPGGRGPGLLLLLVSWAWRALGCPSPAAAALPPSCCPCPACLGWGPHGWQGSCVRSSAQVTPTVPGRVSVDASLFGTFLEKIQGPLPTIPSPLIPPPARRGCWGSTGDP